MLLAEPKNHDEWLECRKKGIGGSQAAAAIGRNKYTSNVDLWRIKTQRDKPPDLSDKPVVQYGKQAEEHIRAIFALDHPEYNIDYHEYRMYANDDNKWLYATLDGELTHKETGELGILEIKTATIQNQMQWQEWTDCIPDSYYIQLLHQMLATGWDFCILRAYIRYYNKDGELNAAVRDFRVDRKDVEEDMAMLLKKEKEFWECVVNDVQPPRILPMLTPQSIT